MPELSVLKKITLLLCLVPLSVTCIPKEEPPLRDLVMKQQYTLPVELAENSGIIFWNNLIWFINDSGNEPIVYGYDETSKKIVKTIFVKNIPNIDWEDISQNDEYIFIGDFGNNMGDRNDLKIIWLKKTAFTVDADTIEPDGTTLFNYSNQVDFTANAQQNSFDCEAFIVTDQEFLLFSKDWLTSTTTLYSFPVRTGTSTAEPVAHWDVKGLITSAAWSPELRKLYLLGYTPLTPFIWTLKNFNSVDYSYETLRQTVFDDFMGYQTEGILIKPNGSLLVSSEDPATIFRVEE